MYVETTDVLRSNMMRDVTVGFLSHITEYRGHDSADLVMMSTFCNCQLSKRTKHRLNRINN